MILLKVNYYISNIIWFGNTHKDREKS